MHRRLFLPLALLVAALAPRPASAQIAVTYTGGGSYALLKPTATQLATANAFPITTAAQTWTGAQTFNGAIAFGGTVSGLTLSKLAQSGATTNQVPQWNGTAWVPATVAGVGGAGTGDVVGPASAVASRIATFDGTTGKLIADGGKSITTVLSDAAADATTKGNAAQAFAVQRGNHTGAQALSTLSQSGATTNQVPQWNGSAWVPATISGGGGSGTVTSVALALPNIFSVSGSPVTTSGTLTGTLATQTANHLLAGPADGGVSPSAVPTFRQLVEADIPGELGSLNWASEIISGGWVFTGAPTFQTLTGLLKGNGSGSPVSAAVPGTDYVVPAGNVATATALASARTIGGTSFNGTANVTSFPAPGPIGGTTPDTGAFSALSITDGSNTTSIAADALTVKSNSAFGLKFWHGTGGSNLNVMAGHRDAGSSLTLGGNYNTVVGSIGNGGAATVPGKLLTTGDNNTIFGAAAGVALTTADSNSLVGAGAGQSITSSYNNALGDSALGSLTTGSNNDSFGYGAGFGRVSGSNNLDLGGYAGLSNTSGSNNVNVGRHAGRYSTGSSEFYLNNQDRSSSAGDQTKSLFYGTFNATETSQTLRVNAVVSAFGTTLTDTSGKILSAALNTVGVAQGGTGAVTLTGLLVGNGTSAVTTVTAPAGTVVGTTDTQTLSGKRITARITTITSSFGTPTINTDNADCVTMTGVSAAITSMTTNLTGTPVNFDQLEFRIKDDGTARAITWGASFVAGAQALPTTTTVNKALRVWFEYDSVVAKWVCLSSGSDL